MERLRRLGGHQLVRGEKKVPERKGPVGWRTEYTSIQYPHCVNLSMGCKEKNSSVSLDFFFFFFWKGSLEDIAVSTSFEQPNIRAENKL